MRLRVGVLLALSVTMLLTILAAPLAAQLPCPDDEIQVVAHADTLLVEHRHAFRNCCTELSLDFTVADNIVDFFEGETGPLCDCMCCFDLHYSACGFTAGHYTVRLWNDNGTELYGSVEVDVSGEANVPEMVTADRGKCIGPSPVATQTWSLMKEIYK